MALKGAKQEMRTANGKKKGGMTITRTIKRAQRAYARGVWGEKFCDKMDYFWCILRHFGRHMKANFQPTTQCFFFNKMYREKKKKNDLNGFTKISGVKLA